LITGLWSLVMNQALLSMYKGMMTSMLDNPPVQKLLSANNFKDFDYMLISFEMNFKVTEIFKHTFYVLPTITADIQLNFKLPSIAHSKLEHSKSVYGRRIISKVQKKQILMITESGIGSHLIAQSTVRTLSSR